MSEGQLLTPPTSFTCRKISSFLHPPGFHCAKFFKKRGDGVLGLDNFNPYYPVGIKYDRAQALEKEGVYTFQADLNDRSLLAV